LSKESEINEIEDQSSTTPSKNSMKEEKNGHKEKSEKETKPLETKSRKKSSSKPEKPPIVPIFVMVIMFIVSIGFAMLLAPMFINMGLQADFSELGGEQSLLIPFFYLAVILIFTAVILFITRKRRGGFIKYGFLGVICISMVYVFFAIFSAFFYPIPSQSWSGELGIDDGVSTITIADIFPDGDEEIIVGTPNGDVLIYDSNRELLWSTDSSGSSSGSATLPGPVSDFAVIDLNRDSRPELIVLAGSVTIFESSATPRANVLNSTWQSVNNNYNAVAVTHNYPIVINSSLGSLPAVILNWNSESTNTGNLERISYYNESYKLESITALDFPVTSLTYGSINDMDNQEIIIGTINTIYSLNLLKIDQDNFLTQQIRTETAEIIDMQIINFNKKGSAEFVFWDSDGHIFIYEANNTEPRWERNVGNRIGGITFGDLLEGSGKNYVGFEMVVSVDGKVIIYYSQDGFLNEKYKFTDEAGELNSAASGLGITDIGDDGELDIIAGYDKGLKDYHYLSPVYSDVPCIIGGVIALLLTVLLAKYPEWYLVDIVGIIVAAGVAALIGVSIGLLPILILLLILAIYDAISVYKTKHMVSLADRVMEFKLPVLLVVPKHRGYSFIRQGSLQKQLDDDEEREAMFIGLGDIIIPGTLVISAMHFLPTDPTMFGFGANFLVAIFTLVGILFGFSALMHFVLKGNPQAGLPLLNTGAILGFFISNYILYQDITFGLIQVMG
jgi:presenilin-like A22 family membrane protease